MIVVPTGGKVNPHPSSPIQALSARKEKRIMRAPYQEYQAVEEAAMKFVKSVAEGNSQIGRAHV